MADPKTRHALQSPPSAEGDAVSEEVALLADAVGQSSTTLIQVMRDFLAIVTDPIIAGGFAMAHHGRVRATVDIDVLAVGAVLRMIRQFEARGYKHESIQLPVGALDLLTKGNKGVDFLHLNNEELCRSMANRAEQGTFLKRPVRFVSLEDLILLKRMALRGRKGKMDEADLEVLEQQSFDAKYVELWRARLGLGHAKN